MDLTNAGLVLLFVVSLVPVLPTEATVLSMGVTAAQGGTSLALVIAVGAAGGVLSDQALYALGRFGGARILTRLRGRRKFATGLDWLSDHVQQHPRQVLVAARWLPSGGTIGALLAGSMRWPAGVFRTASAVGVTLWTSYAAFLGYAGGELITEPGYSLLISLGVATILSTAITFGIRRGVHAH
ncbi:DedA family protein [Amycolatopsis panacis]|uniref:DedA family protein n=1 Tax=Amycolatopsis panacis TaxID=2340917 RepID=A0A419I563_9PSEU|nr:VTT domain-containing protein [Amycolatopsis panacis]RJQ85823.1 DedA family protein [Amycolatopsis panacis]